MTFVHQLEVCVLCAKPYTNIICSLFFSVWAKPEVTIQTEAEGGWEEKQPNAKEKRWKHNDPIQKEGSRANGYAYILTFLKKITW